MRYLNGTYHHGIWYPKGRGCSLVGLFGYDFTWCKPDRKSTSGTCHIFENYLVSWHGKKHHSVALSIVKAEYVAVGNRCA